MSISISSVERIGEVAADPAPVANSGFVYTKDVAGVTQLFYETDAGTVYQITPAASPGDTPWLRTGTFVALDQAGDTQVNPFTDNVTSLGTAALRWSNVFTSEVDMPASAGDPAGTAGVGKLYTKGAGVLTQLWFVDGAGLPHQITPAGVASPWNNTTTAGFITENVVTENVLIGTTAVTGARKLVVVATNGNNDQGIRVESATAGDNALDYLATGDAFVTMSLTGLGLSLGGGAAAPDVRLARLSANKFAVSDNGVSSGAIVPLTDLSVNGTLGDATHRWINVFSAELDMPASAGDPAGTAGVGKLYTKGAGALTQLWFVDGAGLAHQITPAGTASPWTRTGTLVALGQAGDTKVNPFTDNATDVGTSALRWKSFSGGSFNSYGGTAIPMSSLGTGGLAMGSGAAAPDVALVRTSANIFDISNAGAGSGSLQPFVSGSGTIGTTGTAASKAFQSVSVTNNLGVYAAAPDANPVTSVGSAFVKFGVGGATAVDVGIERAANNTIAISDGGANSGNLAPKVANTGTNGSFATPWQSQSAGPNGFFVVTAGDANSKANLSSDATGGSLSMGIGGATALDTRIHRTAAAEITIDDAAGGDVNVIPATDHGTNAGASLGLANRRWAQVNAFEVNTGDVVFTDPGCVVCGQQFEEGDDLVMRVIKIHEGPHGRRTRTVPAHHDCK